MTSRLEQPLALATTEYLHAIEVHAALLVDAAQTAGLDAPVPTCPGWSVRDLVQHTESVYRHKTATVLAASSGESPPWSDVGPEADLATFQRALDNMRHTFEKVDLSAECWTWCAHTHRADWWVRRMAHETVIHAADAVVAAGGSPEIEADLAVDGVDELLDEFLVGGPSWGSVQPGSTRIDLLSTDRAWALRFAAFSGTSPNTGKTHDLDTLVIDAEGTPDAVVDIDPATLDLWLWGRSPLPDAAVSGDRTVVDRLRTLAAEGTG